MNQNNPNQPIIDYIQNYMRNDYMDDLHFIFQLDYEREGGRRPWLTFENAADAKTKSSARAASDPMRHFVFSSIFMFQLMANLTIWDDMSQKGYESPDEDPDDDEMDYGDYEEFHENSGWPDFGLDIWKEFSPRFSQNKLNDLKEVMDRYGLMTTVVNDGCHRFLLACIFDVLLMMLHQELFGLDISTDVCDRIVDSTDEYSKRILATLFN